MANINLWHSSYCNAVFTWFRMFDFIFLALCVLFHVVTAVAYGQSLAGHTCSKNTTQPNPTITLHNPPTLQSCYAPDENWTSPLLGFLCKELYRHLEWCIPQNLCFSARWLPAPALCWPVHCTLNTTSREVWSMQHNESAHSILRCLGNVRSG